MNTAWDYHRPCRCRYCLEPAVTTGRKADAIAGVASIAAGFVIIAAADVGWMALAGWATMLAGACLGVRYFGDGS